MNQTYATFLLLSTRMRGITPPAESRTYVYVVDSFQLWYCCSLTSVCTIQLLVHTIRSALQILTALHFISCIHQDAEI